MALGFELKRVDRVAVVTIDDPDRSLTILGSPLGRESLAIPGYSTTCSTSTEHLSN